MYAVIKTGGKQYKVAIGDRLKVEKLTAEAGESVRLDRVLMVADGAKIEVGAPLVETAVSAKVLSHGRGTKIRVFKMKRRKDYRRTQGHRQYYTEIEITAIGDQKAVQKPVAKKVATKVAEDATKPPKKVAKTTTKKAKTTKTTKTPAKKASSSANSSEKKDSQKKGTGKNPSEKTSSKKPD